MKPVILIAGAGLSGLSAAWHLHRRGIKFKLIDARDRFGGRGLTANSAEGAFDLGPSWVWHGQPHVTKLLQHFDIASHDQYCDGILLHETADGVVHQNPYLKPMQFAQRIGGGVASLVTALAADLPSESIVLGCQLESVEQKSSGVRVLLRTSNEKVEEVFSSVAVAFPPRIAGQLSFTPELSTAAQSYLVNTPTWMAAQAKFFAVYDQPFWRDTGFSGDVFSATGVLAEVHDACKPGLVSKNDSEGGSCALFGFLRPPATERAQLGESSLVESALQQLATYFGDAALSPTETYLKDWSMDAFTAAQADAVPLSHHPQYRACPALGDPWQGRLQFIGAETSASSGGLIEGALQRGAEFAATVS